MDAIDTAINALRSRDGAEYRDARAAFFRAEWAYEAAGKKVATAGAKHYQTLERHIARALKPHRVEWRHPASMRLTGHDINGLDWTASAHLSGEVYPAPKAGKYSMQMRVTLPFSITPRDAAEFRNAVALLRAAANAIADGGL